MQELHKSGGFEIKKQQNVIDLPSQVVLFIGFCMVDSNVFLAHTMEAVLNIGALAQLIQNSLNSYLHQLQPILNICSHPLDQVLSWT